MDYHPSRRRRGASRKNGLKTVPSLNVLTLNKLVKLAFFGFIALLLFVAGLFVYYSFQVPQPGTIAESKYTDATRIYDRKGKLLYSVFADQNRTYVPFTNISENLRHATVAIEDKNFYKNKGFDPLSPFRIAYNFIFKRRAIGGSGITQQLVKNVLFGGERSLSRKIKELIMAIQVDNKFTKDQILEMYLNNIGYGGASVGIEAGAQTYFNKSAKDLDLPQSAFLAGLPQNPNIYSPFTGNTYYISRSKEVLSAMVGSGYITQKQADTALKKIETYKFSQHETQIKAPHFVLYVKELLGRQFGDQMVERGGLQVTTTLDYDIQKKAEEIVKTEIDKIKNYKVGNGAAIISDPKTGEILSMVGSKDYFGEAEPDGCTSGKDCVFEPNYNTALAPRQPGSSLKPIIYAKAFEKGYTPATMLMDVKTNFQPTESDKPYTPENYDGKFRGPVQVRFALGNSLNIPAVKMLAMVGIKDSMQKAYDMGIENWEPTTENMKNVGLSLVLGGRETTLHDEVTAFGTFANKGTRKDLVSILTVKDSRGKMLYEKKDTPGQRVLSEEVAFLISHILLDNIARTEEFGPNSYLKIAGKTVSVKTGTTDEKRDNWTIGYTPSFVVGVWVGNNDNSKMNQAIASGITGASPIWNRLMTMVLKGKNDEQFPVPANAVAIQVDASAGGQAAYGFPTRTEYFVKGTEPTAKSPFYKDKDGKIFIHFHEDDPISTDGKNRWQEAIDQWVEQNHKDDEKYHPPGGLFDNVSAEKKDESSNTPTPEATVTPVSASPTP
jgi:penicillin-binding protein 1C